MASPIRLSPSRAVAALLCIVGFFAACGTEDPSASEDGLASEPAETARESDTTESSETAASLGSRVDEELSATSSLRRQGFPDECPDTTDVFRVMNDATYQVVQLVDFVDQSGQQQSVIFGTGTAWAVGDRLLATNAHVAEGFADSAAAGVQITRAVAVRAGTGEVVRLLRAIVHPSYNSGPIVSPDVALFTTQEELPTRLDLAPPDSVLELGDEISLVGFPGDVDDFVFNLPGLTVPQATSLSGSVTARRSYDPTVQVDVDSLDQYQHQAPTTPGTSGSAVTHCGLVAGINNAGTVKQFVTPPRAEGEQFGVERQAAASNNFAAHVKHIHEIVSLFDDSAVQGFELPVEAAPTPPQPSSGGGETSGSESEVSRSGTYRGTITSGELSNEFQFTVADDGSITGQSSWPATGQFSLTGSVDNDGNFRFVDDAPEVVGYRRGTYEGRIDANGSFTGTYFEEGQETAQFEIAGSRAG